MNIYDDMHAAVRLAEHTLKAADKEATAMAKLLIGRLRKVEDWNHSTLKSLKKELDQFNARTGQWKESA